MSPIELDTVDLALCLGLIGLAVVISLWQKLDLASQFLHSAGRALLQLLVVGYAIDIVFALNNPIAVIVTIGLMLSIAAVVARNRIAPREKQLLVIVWLAIFASLLLTLSYVIVAIVQPVPWYRPQYLIPLAGMLLGNAMNSAALSGERLTSTIKQNYLEIETYLSLGATPQQAIADYQKEAIRTGLIPILNNMMVVGLVSLPGMFTGQILAGADPLNAASYQILILFAIAFTNFLVAVLITEGVYRRFFNQDSQLLV